MPSPSGNERRVAELIAELFGDIGLHCELDNAGESIGGDCGNISARVPGNRSDVPPLLLNAHMDTVVPCEGVNPEVREGVIYSDGNTVLGGDDKTGVITIIEVARELLTGEIPHGDIEIVITVAEETGLHGAFGLDTRLLRARHAFVFDGSWPFRVTIAAPSQENLSVTIHGKAAHAGVHPEDGISAILLASQAISQMKLGRIDEETTANVGVIQGGRATNIIPDTVELQCEARSRDRGKLDAQIAHMRTTFEKVASVAGGRAEIEITPKYEAYRIDTSDLLCQCVMKAAATLGVEPVFQESGGGSDANVFNHRNIHSVVVGCGQQNIHTTAERINMDHVMLSIRNAVELVRSFSELAQP